MSKDRDLNSHRLNRSHWGVFEPIVADGQLIGVRPFARDADPSPILQSTAELRGLPFARAGSSAGLAMPAEDAAAIATSKLVGIVLWIWWPMN
jgi:hypothetical protein